MKLLVFSVYDAAVQAFMQPFFARSKGEALRSFQMACNDEKHEFHRNFNDYTLFWCADFDDSSGSFVCLPAPERVLRASEAIEDRSLFPPDKQRPSI